MLLHALSATQKAQLRNAFTLIDGESRDSAITKADLISLYKTVGLEVPKNKDLDSMLGGKDASLTFTQFLNIMAQQLQRFDDRTTLYNALKVFAQDSHNHELVIDVDELKEACCSVKVEEAKTKDSRLSRNAFDALVKDFVKEQIDGKRLFMASKWLDTYVD